MTENERKIKRRVQLIVGGAVVGFVCLLVTLTVLLAVRINRKGMENSLRARGEQLTEQLQAEQGKADYYMSDRFIDEYALRELGYGRDGAQIFTND